MPLIFFPKGRKIGHMSAANFSFIDIKQYRRELPNRLKMERLVEGSLFTLNARLLGMAGKALTTTALLEDLTPVKRAFKWRMQGNLVVLNEDLERDSVYQSIFVNDFWAPEPTSAMVIEGDGRRRSLVTEGYFLGYDDGSDWFEATEVDTSPRVDVPVDSGLVRGR